MALTRRFLNALGIEADKVDEIITAHSETVTGLKAEIEQYKGSSDKLAETEKQLEKAQKELETLKSKAEENTEDGYKEKYEALQGEYEAYKKDVQAREEKDRKIKAYRELLKDAKIPEKRFDAIVKLSDDILDKLEIDKDGKVSNKDEIVENITSEWSEYVQATEEQGAHTATPPANTGGNTKKISRAAQIAQQYHDDLYGKIKED